MVFSLTMKQYCLDLVMRREYLLVLKKLKLKKSSQNRNKHMQSFKGWCVYISSFSESVSQEKEKR